MELAKEIGEETGRKSAVGRFTPGSWGCAASRYGDKWEAEPDVDRVVDGLAPEMVRRNKAIGNGQVPLVAAYAVRVLETIDR